MDCPACGQQNREGAAFCSNCGGSLARELRCPRCGAANAPTHRFCDACGQALAEGPDDGGQAGQDAEGGAGRVRVSSLGEGSPRAYPTSFAGGRYQVQRFLGEGGKKRVYLAHDTRLNRDVAFAVLKTEGLDDEGRARIRREAQAMARLGDHPHVVAVYDIGEEDRHAYLVCQYMAGGDLARLVREAESQALPIESAIEIADQVCQALEHAHSHGVIHRDLKPGNVWLTGGLGAGGSPIVVKLGDFGLAMSLDQSRLTQAGMMVGTVSYMAPEQALGSEVTPRSDLYSLGALLYELVTGRPPFVGDESVAIITQHLNTPPVAPTWHRQDCPPGLEALIIRLLEKDPAKRPQSASEVRQLLAGVAAPTPTPPPFPPPAGSDLSGEGRGEGPRSPAPIYRSTFVGREAELRQLQAAFDGALSGRGALVLVVGEPGIGKTALCEQLATYAAMRGGKPLVGHCYEEGSLTLPYLPFVEALRTYVLDREPAGLEQDLGTGAAEVARIVSEVREKLAPADQGEQGTGQHPRHLPRMAVGPADPDEERWRLFQAVTSFLRNAASVSASGGLVIVLEDLHWADGGTLDLLVHLARNLQGARLLIIGTYRDVEVDRSHPLSTALADLRRAGDLPRVLLRGLTPDEVQRMVNAISGQDVRWGLAEAIHRQTEGNPLFIQEVLRYLVEEGLVVRQGDHWVGSWREGGGPAPELAMPEGLRDVIGKRLSRLSPECNRVLAVAAVIGRDFALETLRLLEAAPSEEALVAALEEATRVGVLEDVSRASVVRFRFAHAFFRQTLYEEIFTPRRLRLHQEVARALERQYASGGRAGGEQEVPLTLSAARSAGRLEEHAAELAEHFAQSSDPDDLRKAVAYGQLAAQRAMAVNAYSQAARHLEQAVEAQEVLDPDDRATRCDLLLALGQALGPAGEAQRVVEEVCEDAFTLAEALDDQGRAARISALALASAFRYISGARGVMPVTHAWRERLDRYALPGTVERVRADIGRYTYLFNSHRWTEARDARLAALALARELGGPWELFESAANNIQPGFVPPYDQAEASRLAEELTVWPREGVSALTLFNALKQSAGTFLQGGDRRRAEAIWRNIEGLATRTQDPVILLEPLSRAVVVAVLDGDLTGAVEHGAWLVEQASNVGSRIRGMGNTSHLLHWPLLYLGRAEEALAGLSRERLELGLSPSGGLRWGRAPYCLAVMGRTEEARRELQEALRDFRVAEDEDVFSTVLADLLTSAVAVSDRDAIKQLAGRLAGVTAVTWVDLTLTNVARFLGDAARLLGDPAGARENYDRGLDWATRIRHRPEIALTRLALAELLLDEGVSNQWSATSSPGEGLEPHALTADQLKAEASEHVDFCIAELGAMKMQPSLERALSLKDLTAR